MRRRSTRSSAKISPEKPADSPPRKLRLRSRKKRSSSNSSSEDTETSSRRSSRKQPDKVDLKTADVEPEEEKQEVEIPPKNEEDVSVNISENQHENIDIGHNNRNTNESDNQLQDEPEKDGEKENSAEKVVKGKSKSKRKSKSDNSLQVSESESHKQNEISENAQVTTQSPSHISVNIPSDNALSTDKIVNPSTENVISQCDPENKSEVIDHKDNIENDGDDKKTVLNDEKTDKSDPEDVNITDETSDKNNGYQQEVNESEKTSAEASESETVTETERNDSNEELMKDKIDKNDLNESVDKNDVTKDDVSESLATESPENIESSMQEDTESSFNVDTTLNLTDSCIKDVEQMVESNREIQQLKSEVEDIFRTPEPRTRKRKWGNSVVSLNLIETSVSKIDVESIKSICPDVTLLDEKDVKLEVKEKKKPEVVERKVSVSSDDGFSKSESDNSHIIAMNRKISIVDDTASKLRPPPSPAKNPVSSILFITNLVRPFTLKQLKELLERTGKIKENGFWTDKVKSKCYVNYETEEEAEATRNALHGVNWPVGNSKQLSIEFSTEEEMELAKNPPPVVTPVEPSKAEEKEGDMKVRDEEEVKEEVGRAKEREKVKSGTREWDLEKLDRRRPSSRERDEMREKRRHRRSPTPDFAKRKHIKEDEIPQKRMDDLFRKTKASPSIYWLPLTPEEIAIKEQQRLERMAEHKRRMEETTSRNGRNDYGRGAAYKRRY